MVLQHIRKTVGEYNFAGQYQQRPVPLGGGMVKTEWLRFYNPGEQPARFDLVFQSWDTANKATELSNYSVCTTWAKKGNKLFLLNVFRKRLDYPELKRALRQQHDRFRPRNILIEDKASGTQLIQELIREGLGCVSRYEPTMDKVMRMHSVTTMIENGFVWLPAEADWLADYIRELTSFPGGKHDDQVDSTSQALDWAKTNTGRLPLPEFYIRYALKNGLPLESWMLDELREQIEAEGPPTCPKCQSQGPAQNGRICHCNHCGHKWELRNPFANDVHRCVLDGAILEWNAEIEVWVNPQTGQTYPPGPG